MRVIISDSYSIYFLSMPQTVLLMFFAYELLGVLGDVTVLFCAVEARAQSNLADISVSYRYVEFHAQHDVTRGLGSYIHSDSSCYYCCSCHRIINRFVLKKLTLFKD